MRFDRPFLRLPIRFCAETLAREVKALPQSAWMPHPQNFPGNESAPLVSPGGQTTHSWQGPMDPTPHLLDSPYMKALLAELGGVWGRSRLMGLAPGAEVPLHVDIHYYWRTHIRIHIPIVTNPDVRFTCGDEAVHMAAGECWTFDSFRLHHVRNGGSERRIHLVIDTVGGARIWELMDSARNGAEPPAEPWFPRSLEEEARAPRYERTNLPDLMSPWEVQSHVEFLCRHAQPHPRLEEGTRRLDKFLDSWRAAWAEHGDSDRGIPAFRSLVEDARRDLRPLLGDQVLLQNTAPLYHALEAIVFTKAVTRGQQSQQFRPRPAAFGAAR